MHGRFSHTVRTGNKMFGKVASILWKYNNTGMKIYHVYISQQ